MIVCICVCVHRKFDIRQWVLVTSSSPMTAWFYDECYLRFCAEDYSLTDLTNVFSHLSNNCIARKSLHFTSGLALIMSASGPIVSAIHESTHESTG